MANQSRSPEMATTIGVGGLLTVKDHWHLYKKLLHIPDHDLHPRDRFLPIPDKGLSPMDEMYGQLEEQLFALHDKSEERVALVGHSLGGLMVTMLGLENPDKVSSVTCLAGAQEGVKTMTPTGWLLKWSLQKPPGADDIKHDSDFMMNLRERVATEWSPETSLHLVSPTYDDLLLVPQGLGLEIPEGQKADRRVVAPPLPGVRTILKLVPGMPEDVEIIPSFIPSGHIDVVLSRAVINHHRAVRSIPMLDVDFEKGLSEIVNKQAVPVAA